MYSAATILGKPIDRRHFARTGLALGALALTLPLAGCDSFLGIKDPTAETPAETEEPPLSPNTVEFEGLVITLGTDPATWTWDKINNPQSANNGSLVVTLPISITNGDESSHLINSHYCKVIAPDGQVQADISGYYTDTDILRRGNIPAGATEQAVIHIPYRGAGTYQLEFDNLLGRKAQLPFDVSGSQASGLRPLPDGDLGSTSAQNATPYGTAFSVGNLTLVLSADEDSFLWIQAWDPTNDVWNGRWCVGVPLSITNNGTEPQSLTADLYKLYAPRLYPLEDAAPWFGDPSPDYVTSATYIGPIQPGQTVETMLYWPYDEDGWYYAAFDNDGFMVVASARIAQYS